MDMSKTRYAMSCIGIVFALCLGAFGQVTTMDPMFCAVWHATAAGAAFIALLSPIRGLRLTGALLALLFGLIAWFSYQRGLKYEEQMREDLFVLSAI